MKNNYDQQMMAVKAAYDTIQDFAKRYELDLSYTIAGLNDAYSTIAAVKAVEHLEPKETDDDVREICTELLAALHEVMNVAGHHLGVGPQSIAQRAIARAEESLEPKEKEV